MRRIIIAAVLVLCILPVSLADDEREYEAGGPLAGLKLPLFPTKHGEKPGHPGCLPGRFSDEGLQPQRHLYPGSVENWRANEFKYCPARSFFDRQSLIREWAAPDIPVASRDRIEQYATPLYWVPRHARVQFTGEYNPPVPVVRAKPGESVFRLDLGRLEPGLYAIRLVGAVEMDNMQPFRHPVYARMRVNDGIDGGTSNYRVRLRYCDEFYSAGEIYFHAPESRQYEMEVAIDEDSAVNFLLQAITLDDALAGAERRALKTRTTVSEPPENPAPSNLTDEERLIRDKNIWRGLPPVNAQGTGWHYAAGGQSRIAQIVRLNSADMPAGEITEKFGAWERAARNIDEIAALPEGTPIPFLVNRHLDLEYTVDDLRAGNPLPDPFPYKDDGAGLFYPDENGETGAMFAPVAMEVSGRLREYANYINAKAGKWRETGDIDAAHDAAIALTRFAYDFPTKDAACDLAQLVVEPGAHGREWGCRHRMTMNLVYPHYPQYVDPILYNYDQIFSVIQGNERLAESVGRFVPWVETPEDVIELIDVYLVQTTAKRILRYHYTTGPVDIAKIAAIVGDTEVTDQWMDWLFSATFIYPLPPSGIQDAMITGCGRNGAEYIGSVYYAAGEGASRVAQSLEEYINADGNPKYDLSNRQRYPKPVEHIYWNLHKVVAGWDFLRIGDVASPAAPLGYHTINADQALFGWRWTGDPRFAAILRQYNAKEKAGVEWEPVLDAAEGIERAPWLENRSRMMPMWAGVLESGLQYDDPRLRRAAYLRIGFGWGHHHNDTLDLQVVAHGLPATVDGGMRPGYSVPGDRSSRVHNLVQVDGREFQNHSWATALSDAEGARYVAAEAAPPAGANHYSRQMALIDVNEAAGPIDNIDIDLPLPADIVMPNSYVFDCVRVSGGREHTYNFHALVKPNEGENMTWNVPEVDAPAEGTPEAAFLAPFKNTPESWLAGDAPEVFEATWEWVRFMSDQAGLGGSEERLLGKRFDPDSPRRFTKLHLLGVEGHRAMRADVEMHHADYKWTTTMVQRREDNDIESAYAAIIEPYLGDPFISDVRMLNVVDNETHSRRAVAVQVKTSSGNTDLCFADGRRDKARRIEGWEGGPTRIAGEFAYLSVDEDGIRQAVLTGATLLEAPGITIRVGQAERTGKVVKVDYAARSLWIDQSWPAHDASAQKSAYIFEIGTPEHMTSYTAVEIDPDDEGSRIVVDLGADYYRSQITDIDPETGVVQCVLPISMGRRAGIDKNWVASDDEGRNFWRADYIDDKTFRLQGAPVSEDSFAPSGALRLWEYGVGDSVRHSTFAGVRRVDGNEYELEANADVDLTIGNETFRYSADDLSRAGGTVLIEAGR